MIIGHQKQWQFLKKSFENNRLSHAYLFSGPDSLGKKTIALDFVKLILGKEHKELVEKKKHPDLLFIKSEKKEIQISQIRELQVFLSYKSYYGSFKVVIIDEAEKMNQEAQSCFLKTLEEPKGKTLLILISSHPELLLPTIYSRCQIIKFFPVRAKEIKDYLLGQGVPEKKAETLSRISQGRPGEAINFLLNPQKLEQESQIVKEILELLHSDFTSRLQYAKNLSLSNNNLNKILEIFQRYFRYILFWKMGIMKHEDFNYFPSPSKKLESYSTSKLKKIIKFTDSVNFLISSTNINPKLALEVLLLQL